MSHKGGKTLPVINLQSQTKDTLESVRTLTMGITSNKILPPSPSYQLQVGFISWHQKNLMNFQSFQTTLAEMGAGGM